MMVVMLIMSIILAAMAPVMTTRNKSDYSSPWRYSPRNNSDAYFGAGDNQVALLGQSDAGDAERDTKLLIRTAEGSGFSHLLFKTGDAVVGRLYLDESNLYLSNIANPSGSGSTSIGVDALSSNTGENNTAIGNNALHSNNSGNYNTAIGTNTLRNNTSGEENTGIGYQALSSNTTGGGNVGIGNFALDNNTTGNYNIGIGFQALNNNQTGEDLIGIGMGALYSNNGGEANIGIGSGALRSNTTGNNNIALGTSSLYSNETGTSNIGIGSQALWGNASGYSNVAIGSNTLRSNDEGYDNVALGSNTLYSNTTGFNNIGIGRDALYTNDTGYQNIAQGTEALYSNTTGYQNIALGQFVLQANTTGYKNIGIGQNALYLNEDGFNNIAFGEHALYSNTSGDFNIAIGSIAMNSNDTGRANIAIGNAALGSNKSGTYNIAIGSSSLVDLESGSNNIGIGREACKYVTGSNKICIGPHSGPESGGSAATGDSKMIYLGDAETTVVLPGRLIIQGGAPNREYSDYYSLINFGHTILSSKKDGIYTSFTVQHNGRNPGSGSTLYMGSTHSWGDKLDWSGAWSQLSPSDRRLKYVGKENTSGLDKIRQLKVFNYTFKKDEKKTPHVGVIAQDLQKVFPDAVKKGVDGFLTIRMEDMFYAVINAIKELDSRVTSLEKENQELKARIERLESKIK